LDALCAGVHSKKVSYILDTDIRLFFDEISQEWLIRFLEHRIGDRRIIRLIQKWLKEGTDLCGGRAMKRASLPRPVVFAAPQESAIGPRPVIRSAKRCVRSETST
jgi:hypothetical protein